MTIRRKLRDLPTHLNLALDEELLRCIDNFWHGQRCKNRSEAIRELLHIGLATYEQGSITVDAVQEETDEVYSDQ